ncbi:MAG: transporter [Spirochaetes bacterium]|nr:transporter [Spirochaetota bacterium]
MSKFFTKLSGMPIAAVAATMGAMTLSNAWNGLGFVAVRDITIGLGILVGVMYLCRIIIHPKAFKADYEKTVPCSLHGAGCMMFMIYGVWLTQWFDFGRFIFLAAFWIHVCHILVFTYRNVLRGIKAETFVPSWFVTYNGIMVCTVVGAHILGPELSRIVVFYGLTVYPILIISLVIRLLRVPLPPPLLHTTGVALAPVSLSLASFINVFGADANIGVITAFYIALLITVTIIVANMGKYFAVPFNPGFSGLTFPMAIGAVASLNLSVWFANNGFEQWSEIVRQIGGIQLFLTTIIIGVVLFNLLRMGIRALRSAE